MRRLASIISLFCLFFVQVSLAQFTQIASPVGGSQNFAQISGSAAWGDYDADGDLDLVMAGRDANFVNRMFIYRNNGDGTFSVADADTAGGTQLIPLNDGGLAWGDFDNDGDLDFVVTGFEQVPPDQPTPRRTLLYQNTPGGFNLVGNPVDGNASFAGNNRFDPTWVDFDGDGDLDLYIGGIETAVTDILDRNILYRNNGDGTFTALTTPVDQTSPFEGYSEGAAAWGDLTGNGYPDLFSEGANGFQGINSTFYENNGSSTFSLIFRGRSSVIGSRPGGRLGDVRLVDFDNDGDLDLYLSGETSGNSFVAGFYANDGNNQFTFVSNIQAGFRGFTGHISGGASWGDYDGDGDSDIAYGGFGSSSRFTRLEQNVGNNDFDQVINPIDGNTSFTGLSGGSVIFGDYDGDGDLDLLVQGVPSSNGAPQVNLFQNTANHNNAAPTAPANMSTVRTPNGVRFFWDAATDDATPSEGLNYNMRIGTTPGGSEVLAPMSIVGGQNDGKRLIPNRGMIQGTNARMNLPNGTYYWSVQAIDPGHNGSAFSAEQMVTVTDFVATPPSAFALLTPADNVEGLGATPSEFTWEPAADAVDLPEEVMYIFELSDDEMFANKLDSVKVSGDTTYSTVASLGDGTYYWRVSAMNSSGLTTFGSGSDTAPFRFTIGQAVSTEDGPGGIPTQYSLEQNFPNPFNPTTNIAFSIPQAGSVSINVYNILGQQVASVTQGRFAAGTHTVTFNASSLSSGVYIYQLRAGNFIQTRKLTLVK